MIHKSPTRKHMSRFCNYPIPQTPVFQTGGGTFSNRRRKSSVTPLTTPLSTTSVRRRSRQSSPSRSSMISSPTRTSSGSSSRGRSADGLVNLDNVLEGGTTQQCRGTISVSIRLKPSDTNTRSPWYTSDDHTIVHNELGEFWFDKVFPPQTNNYGVYEEIGKPMIDKLFQGYNATIFAYGMTGSGKTFTMSGTRDEAGLILLSVEQIFAQIMKESVNNKSYEVKVSYLEIYNEKIYDLLNYPSAKSPGGAHGSFQSKNVPSASAELPVRDDARHGVRVVGLTEQQVHSSEDVLRKIELGNSNRRTGETDYNTRSSRSHAIVTIKVACTELLSGTETTSTLSLCDLAGSERAAGQHERRKEGAFINKSLLALGTVISKLSAVSTAGGVAAAPPPTFGNSHVPYRDSKLTRILQPALSGDSIVTTICTIDTKPDAMSETVNTIRFASRAKNVSMTVKRNEAEVAHDKNELLQSLRRQLDEQQDLICELRRAQPRPDQDSCEATPLGLSATVLMLRRENETLKKKLQHCERLLDKDDAAVEDEQFVEIVEMLPPAIGALLESKIQGLESQLREHRVYNAQLEQRLSEAEAEARLATQQARAQTQALPGDEDGTLQRLVREQEEELEELQRSLTRKNKMLDALQSAKRLREGALRPLNRGLGAGADAGPGRVAHKGSETAT
ncbi:LAQU0S01e05688g1_1 [Lachancea quebecensis]|uniref:Kinesin-like protein n=1 Tax=Lachancea quebecensis TaxID=1654605 RepID=A0A0P1KL93_9SACH|nr:LAQU0S01e05688g1_1 [Lachancea quebecensis]